MKLSRFNTMCVFGKRKMVVTLAEARRDESMAMFWEIVGALFMVGGAWVMYVLIWAAFG